MEENGMTNEQAQEFEILIRIDQLDRVQEITTDEAILKWIEAEKRALRAKLKTL